MPEENSFVRFYSGQYQFKVSFAIYVDFERFFKVWRKRGTESPNFMVVPFLKLPTQALLRHSAMKQINFHIPSGFCTYSMFAYRKVKNPLKLSQGKEFCKHIRKEAKGLYHMLPERPMKHLTQEE